MCPSQLKLHKAPRGKGKRSCAMLYEWSMDGWIVTKSKPLNTPVDAVRNSGMQSCKAAKLESVFLRRLFVLFHELHKGLLMHKASVLSIGDDTNAT